MNRVITVVLLVAVTILPFAIAHASDSTTTAFAAVLDGNSVVPNFTPYPYPAASRIDLTMNDSNQLSFQMYDCLSLGADNYQVQIHGPATYGQIGPVIFTLPYSTTNGFPVSGVIGVLDSQQIRDLNCGLWYIDISTLAYPYGIVRGQIRGLWGWQPGSPCFLATQESTWGAVKARYR